MDQQIYKVIKALKDSSFYEDTIIIYTSDHGDLLGSHGGLFQKWYQSYEESIHVPFIISSPKLRPERKSVSSLTSHVDIMPTILDLAGIDVDKAMDILRRDHTEVHPPVGRSLVPLLLDDENKFKNEPIYFMTDDDPSKTLNSANFLGIPYEPVTQPSHIETIVCKLPTGENHQMEIWKYSRYFDNQQFWTNPGCSDEDLVQHCIDSHVGRHCAASIKTTPASDEYEIYNLAGGPL